MRSDAGKSERLVFMNNEDVVEGEGALKGQMLSSYGPSGPRELSGQSIFGGALSDLGMPVLHSDLIAGTLPAAGKNPLSAAVKIN